MQKAASFEGVANPAIETVPIYSQEIIGSRDAYISLLIPSWIPACLPLPSPATTVDTDDCYIEGGEKHEQVHAVKMLPFVSPTRSVNRYLLLLRYALKGWRNSWCLRKIIRLLSTSTTGTNQTGIPTHLLCLRTCTALLHPGFRRIFRACVSVVLDPDDFPPSVHAHRALSQYLLLCVV